jgi:hypothetical protein
MAILSAIGIYSQTITVGAGALISTGGTNGNPIYRSSAGSGFNFSQSVHLYTAADLAAMGGAANITKFAFYKNDAATLTAGRTATISVYLKNSSASSLAINQTLAQWITGATQVYTNAAWGPTNFPAAAGFLTFDFSATPFAYNGGNLEVVVDWAINTGPAGSTTTGPFTWKYDGVAGTQAVGTSNNIAITTALNIPQSRRYQAEITYTPAPPCSGSPAAATIATNLTSFCPGGSANLSVTSTPPFNQGLTYSWESGPSAAGPFTAIPAATGQSLTVSPTSATFYRLVTTCTPSGLSSNSNVVSVSPLVIPYASIPFSESFENTWATTCSSAPFGEDQPGSNWLGTPSSGDRSWRADNTTLALSGWTSLTGAYAPAASLGARSAKFHTYDAPNGTFGSLDLYVDLSTAGLKQLSFDYINPSGTDSITALLSTDGGLTFPTKLVSKTVSAAWGALTAPLSTTSSTCVIRFLASSDFGLDDIGIDNVNITLPCAGAPIAGSVSGSSSVCTGTTAILGLTGSTVAPGITYQWLSAALASGPYTAIVGANANSYTTGAITTPALYRCIVTCTNSSLFDTTAAFSIGLNAPYQCYCAITNACAAGSSIDSLFIVGTTLNHFQQDCPTTTSSGGDIYPASGNTTASLTIGNNYTIGLKTTGATIQSVWIDYNQNGTYEATEHTQITTASSTTAPITTTTISIPATALPGLTGMRVRTRLSGNANGPTDACVPMGSGEYSDYGITLVAAPLCTTPPVGGAISTSTPTINVGNNATIVATGSVGTNYSWRISTSSAGPFATFSAPDNDTIAVNGPVGVYYLRLFMSTPGCPTDSSNVLTLTVTKILGDDVCDAITIPSAGSYGPYNIEFATTQANETVPPTNTGTSQADDQTGWGLATLNNTMWFKFVATTKKVKIRATFGLPNGQDNDTQLALWQVTSACDSLASVTKGGVTLLAANEDSTGNDYNSIIDGSTFCLTPGNTYYVQADAYGGLVAGSLLFLNYEPIADSTASITGLNNNYCVGSSAVNLAATPAGGTFTVNGTAATSLTPSTAGTYNVVYIFGGCNYTSSQSVTVNDNPTANLPGTISTCNASEILDAGNATLPGVSYLWSNGATTQTTTVSTNGIYSVTVTGNGGCSISDTVNVTLNSGVATANVTAGSPSICEGTSTTLVGTPSGGVFSANGTGGVFNGTSAGTFDVTYTVTSTCGTAIDTVSITVNAAPVTSITPSSPTICAGGTTGVTLTGSPAGGTFSVQSGTASALTGNSFNPATTGTWTIVYTFTNASTCTDTSNINFNVNCTVGLNDLSKGVAAIQVVPNPTSGNFDLNISNAADKATIKLLSFDGRLLSTEKVDLNQNNTVKMNIANYANGIYFVNVISGNVNKTIKITKQD